MQLNGLNVTYQPGTLPEEQHNTKDANIKMVTLKSNNMASLLQITAGDLKNLVTEKLFLVSVYHSDDGAMVLNDYLQS